MAEEKRLRRVPIRSKNISNFLAGNMAVIEGLPDDVEVVRTYEDPAAQSYYFVVRSDEFPPVEEGEEIPETELAIVQRRIRACDYWTCPNCHEVTESGDIIGAK
jgi:hypothetical protein